MMVLMKQLIAYFIATLGLSAAATCKDFPITRGEGGSGVLRLCRTAGGQQLYVSGEMDVQSSGRDRERDLRSIRAAIREMRRLTTGKFEVSTHNAGGGDVDWHQQLMMAVEDNCTGECRIETRISGFCESACAQLHLTCALGARTLIAPGGRYCEHATNDDGSCHLCDTNDQSNCNICDPSQAVMEYKDRCDRLVRGRNLNLDPERRRVIGEFADRLKREGVFSSDRFTCIQPPWAEVQAPPAAGTPIVR